MQPFAYERINETTWMYVSTFLILSFFFKFNRAWSIRNLDLFLIILLAPGLLLIQSGRVEHGRFLQQQSIQRQAPQSPSESQSEPVVNQASFKNASFLADANPVTKADPARTTNEVSVKPGESALGFNEPGMSRQRFGYFWMFGLSLIHI